MFFNRFTRMFKGIAFVGVALLIAAIGMAMICENYRVMLDEFFKTKSVEWVAQGEPGTYEFVVDENLDTTTKLVAAHKAHAIKVQEEGSVLLKNNNIGNTSAPALPLNENAKITLLGMRSHMPSHGGMLGSAPTVSQNVTLENGLKEKGFQVNPTMLAAYTALETDFAPGRMAMNFGIGNTAPAYKVNEPGLADIAGVSENYADSFAEYNDAAIVVIGRPGSEAADLFPGAEGKDPSDGGATNVLGLTANERAIIETAKTHFDNVVVLINTAVPMEIEELKNDEKINAIMWVGFFGNYGSLGIANLLRGKDDEGKFLSPSGSLTDTYAVDSTSAPATQNFGVFTFANVDDIEPGGDGSKYRGNWYRNEAEGIYVGYRYYETRYYDSIMRKASNAESKTGVFASSDKWNYSEEVSYPFGYGLSYTDFEYDLTDVSFSGDKKTATVKGTIENVGAKPGKAAVQLYMQTPYVENGVEKSAVQLIDYGKTPVLDAQGGAKASYSFEIDVDMSYSASYDYKNAKTFIMDGGDYYFTVGNGAHEALNNILAMQGKTTADGMDKNGNADAVIVKKPYGEKGTVDKTFAVSKSGVDVENRLDDVDMNYWQPNSTTYMSRSNWETFPETYKNMSATSKMITQLRNDTYEIKKDDDVSDVKFAIGQKNGLKFGDMKNAAYDDERWDKLLAQLDLDEVIKNVLIAQNILHELSSINFFELAVCGDALGFKTTLTKYADKNAPWYKGKNPEEDPNAKYEPRDWPLAGVLAATFNKDLAYDQGILLGHDSLFIGSPINWGPCVNLHTSPYYGRSQENAAEDPVLGGWQAATLCRAAWTKGTVVALKHFALNDIERNRAGCAAFTNEQKMRELELRSFQIGFENGSLGTMTTFNRIGCTYGSAHKGLLTDILRGEWGFHGYIVTDMINGPDYMTAKESIVAGTSHFDNSKDYVSSNWSYMKADTIKNDATMMKMMKRNMHDTLWLMANSNAMNGKGQNTVKVWLMTWWRAAYIAVIVSASVIALAALGMYVVGSLKSMSMEE